MSAAMLSVLVVDDEVRSLETLRRTLEDTFVVHTAQSADAALDILDNEAVQLVLSDQRMPGTYGVELLRTIRERWPDTVRIILSGYTDAEDIIAGVNDAGIWQYLLKPWHPDQLLLTLQAAANLWRLQQDNQRLTLDLRASPSRLATRVADLRAQTRHASAFSRLVCAAGSPLRQVCDMAERIAGHDMSVLITGESGTGKELLARGIHFASARSDRPFVVENCGAMPDALLESELFGHRRGAFTGAIENKVGLFQQADGGTLFLDEIGETSPAFQVKLLRVLQEGEVRPVGGPRPVPVQVRLIAATNRDLEAEVAAGRFREDLYYRIAGFTLKVPPLRARRDDMPLLVQAVLKGCGGDACQVTDEAMTCLSRYLWPGNVRELQNEIRRALALSDGQRLTLHELSEKLRQAAASNAGRERPNAETPAKESGTLREQLEATEARILKGAMERFGGNKTHVAQELGLTRVGLRMKLARLGMGGD
jgi:two-component system response regulator HupR/HoxA